MKVAFFLPHAADGGVVRASIPLIRQFASHGHELDVLTFDVRTDMLDQVTDVASIRDLGSRRVAASLPAIVSYLRKSKPDALISAQHYANATCVLARTIARTSTRVVVTEREAINEALARLSVPKRTLVAFSVRRAYGRAHAVVANSRASADQLAQFLGWPAGRVHAIYNPIDRARIEKQVAEPLDHSWFEERQPPVVLGVGRFTGQKDFPTLVRAFAKLRRDMDCRLVILGDGPDRTAVQALAQRLGIADSVQLPGFQSNPYKYMSRASLFVLSSRYEGLPNVLLEAQACGVPVIAADCPTGPREILAGGECGLLVPVGDDNAFCEGMFRLLSDRELANQYVKAADKRLVRYSPGDAYESYLSLLTQKRKASR